MCYVSSLADSRPSFDLLLYRAFRCADVSCLPLEEPHDLASVQPLRGTAVLLEQRELERVWALRIAVELTDAGVKLTRVPDTRRLILELFVEFIRLVLCLSVGENAQIHPTVRAKPEVDSHIVAGAHGVTVLPRPNLRLANDLAHSGVRARVQASFRLQVDLAGLGRSTGQPIRIHHHRRILAPMPQLKRGAVRDDLPHYFTAHSGADLEHGGARERVGDLCILQRDELGGRAEHTLLCRDVLAALGLEAHEVADGERCAVVLLAVAQRGIVAAGHPHWHLDLACLGAPQAAGGLASLQRVGARDVIVLVLVLVLLICIRCGLR